MTEPLRLYTFSLSHFSEKIRWLLGAEGLAFEEVAWTPPFHVPEARRRGRGTTVPILEDGPRSVQDSTRIVHWLDAQRGPLRLLPRDEPARAEVLALEELFDGVGADATRLAYAHLLDDGPTVIRLWGIDASPFQRALVRATFPLARAVFRRRLDVGPARLERAREKVERGLAEVERRTESRGYLVGESLTLADVTAAALLAPLACPGEHPVYRHARYREPMEPVLRPYRDRPALAWVRRIYRDHRGVWPREAAVDAGLA